LKSLSPYNPLNSFSLPGALQIQAEVRAAMRQHQRTASAPAGTTRLPPAASGASGSAGASGGGIKRPREDGYSSQSGSRGRGRGGGSAGRSKGSHNPQSQQQQQPRIEHFFPGKPATGGLSAKKQGRRE
jgi:hypothetical protein